jgi:HTH-type transcriptional regulator/antitoxin HigA
MTLTHPTSAASDIYMELVRLFPLRPIRSDEDYDAGAEMLERLMTRADASPEADDYATVLLKLLEDYDRDAGQLVDEGTLSERMRALVNTTSDLTQTRLGEIAGGASRGNVSDVMAGRRGWSKSQMKRLSEHFKLDLRFFLD